MWYLRCSYTTLRKLVQQRVIIPARVSKRNMFLKADLDHYLQTPKREIISKARKLYLPNLLKGRPFNIKFI